MEKLKIFAPVVLRVGIALVMLWFGVSQLSNTAQWVDYVPGYAVSISHLSAATLVHINASVEVIFGVALLLGFFTRIAAFVLALHMLDIVFIVGLDATGVRDFAVFLGTLFVWMYGHDFLTLDRVLKSGSEPIA